VIAVGESEIKRRIVQVCKRLWDRNMLASADGNVSYRIDDETILITPSGLAKAFMDPEQMAVMNLKGEVLHGTPSGERAMHLQVYQSCPEAKAVVHAHPPTRHRLVNCKARSARVAQYQCVRGDLGLWLDPLGALRDTDHQCHGCKSASVFATAPLDDLEPSWWTQLGRKSR
jgi:hypothetical protein